MPKRLHAIGRLLCRDAAALTGAVAPGPVHAASGWTGGATCLFLSVARATLGGLGWGAGCTLAS
jgi:hypothetical protein